MGSWVVFLKNEWLWSLTWGWYQCALGLFFSTLIFVILRKIKSLPTLVLVVTSYWSAFVVYLLLVICSCLYLYIVNSSLVYVSGVHSPCTALVLAIVFSLLQSYFLQIAHQWYRIQLNYVIRITFIGNCSAALCASYLTSFLALY